MLDNLIQMLILQAIKKSPEGLTTRQIQKVVKSKLKLILKYKKIEEQQQKLLEKILK